MYKVLPSGHYPGSKETVLVPCFQDLNYVDIWVPSTIPRDSPWKLLMTKQDAHLFLWMPGTGTQCSPKTYTENWSQLLSQGGSADLIQLSGSPTAPLRLHLTCMNTLLLIARSGPQPASSCPRAFLRRTASLNLKASGRQACSLNLQPGKSEGVFYCW